MHVTPFSAATILVFATASPLHAQGIRSLWRISASYCCASGQSAPLTPIANRKRHVRVAQNCSGFHTDSHTATLDV